VFEYLILLIFIEQRVTRKKKRDRRRLGYELVQKIEALASKPRADEGGSGNISTRLVQTGNEAVLYRITPIREDDWNCRGGRFRRTHRGKELRCDDHRHLTADKL
jgi:hypothetical protein